MGRVSRDLGAGACLLGIAAVATWQGAGLELGTLRQMGPGMFPRVIAVLVGVCGGALGLRSWLQLGSESPPALPPAEVRAPRAASGQRVWRAPLCLLLAATVFGLSVRPLGLVVATPLSLLLAALASPDSRRQQSLWFALGMTIFCVLLFRQLLTLPIPLAPWLLGY
jgi:putative tricarboxylic transport membrane protein